MNKGCWQNSANCNQYYLPQQYEEPCIVMNDYDNEVSRSHPLPKRYKRYGHRL